MDNGARAWITAPTDTSIGESEHRQDTNLAKNTRELAKPNSALDALAHRNVTSLRRGILI